MCSMYLSSFQLIYCTQTRPSTVSIFTNIQHHVATPRHKTTTQECHLTHSHVLLTKHNVCRSIKQIGQTHTFKQVIYDAIFTQMSPSGCAMCLWLVGNWMIYLPIGQSLETQVGVWMQIWRDEDCQECRLTSHIF